MANYIRTKIEISGSKDTLQTIFNAIEKCNEEEFIIKSNGLCEKNWVGNILELLHINAKIVTNYAIWYKPHFNKHGHLCFIEDSKWERSNYADYLHQYFSSEISGVCYSSED